MNFAQNIISRRCSSKNCIIFGLCFLFLILIVISAIPILVQHYNKFTTNNTQINKINYKNSEFLPNINSKISTEKVLIENHNANTGEIPDCSNDTEIEILCEELIVCVTNLYGDEDVVKENENVYKKTNESQNITKKYCNGKLICQSKKLFNDQEWCSTFVYDIVNQSTYTENENSNDTMNDIDNTNSFCEIVDENGNYICFCIIISPQAVLAPVVGFKNGKDELWIKDSKSQIYKMDDIKVHPKFNGTSYNIACGLIKDKYFKESQIAQICPPNQHLSKFVFTYLKYKEEMLPEELQLKSQVKLIREDKQFKRMLCNTTLAGSSKNVKGNYGNPLVEKDENTGIVCVMGTKIIEKKHKKEGEVQIFTNFSQNEIQHFIESIITGELVD